jgi:hypothetical protein
VQLDEGRCYDSEVYFQDLIPIIPKNEDQRGNIILYQFMTSKSCKMGHIFSFLQALSIFIPGKLLF